MQSIVNKYSIKIAILIGFITWITPYTKLERPYWIIITAIAIMLPTVGATLERSKKRAIYTAIGVLVGGMLAYIMTSHLVYIGLFTAILLFFAFYFINTHYSRFVFCVSALLVLLLSQLTHHPWEFAYWRLIDTLIGVILGFAFSLLIFPCWSKKSILKTLKTTLSHLKHLSSLILEPNQIQHNLCEIAKTRSMVIQSTEKLKIEYAEMCHEMQSLDKRPVFMQAIIMIIEHLRFNYYLLMSLDEYPISQENVLEIKTYCATVYSTLAMALDKQSLKIDIVTPNYQLAENPYLTQVIRNHIMDLTALSQNITYYLQRNDR